MHLLVLIIKVFHLHLRTFRTYIHTRLHIHSSSSLLGVTIKPNAKFFAQVAHYFLFQKKDSYFSKTYYHASFQWPKVYGVSVICTSQIHMSCYYLWQGAFQLKSSFVKISQLVQQKKGDKLHGTIIQKGKWLKSHHTKIHRQ